ncbi:MAG TPA: ABC transporter substrate-binding protein, partial [Candidatus Ozemobacteraceae bacterium]
MRIPSPLPLFVVVAIVISIISCPFPAPARAGEPEPLRIGVIGALTGPKAAYGLPHLNGARLAADEVNAAGGIAGHRIELLPADDRGEMGLVGELATRLIFTGRVLALLGSVDSGCTHVAAMIAVKMQVPHLTSVATDPTLTRAGSPWTFRTLADDDRQAAAVVAW